MKKLFFYATVVAMSLAMAIPVNAQSRKDKKAAKKAQWEMEQQQQREEAELRHQMKMDSLRNVQKEKDEAKAKAQAEAEKKAKEQAEEDQLRKMNMVTELPCEAYDDDEWYYAFGLQKYNLRQESLVGTALLRSNRQQLLQKLSGKYQAVTDDYFDQMETEDGGYMRQHIESAGRMIVQQLVQATNELCRKRSLYADQEGKYTMYMSIRVSKKELLEKAIDAITSEQEMKVRFNEKQFRDSAFKVFEEDNKKAYDDFKEQQE